MKIKKNVLFKEFIKFCLYMEIACFILVFIALSYYSNNMNDIRNFFWDFLMGMAIFLVILSIVIFCYIETRSHIRKFNEYKDILIENGLIEEENQFNSLKS